MSDAVFKSLQMQMKETGMAWWACRECLSFSQKINAQFKNMSQRIDGMEEKVNQNSESITRVGILKQNAKSRYSGIPGFEVRRNLKIYYLAELFFKHWFIAALYTLYTVPE